MQMAATGGTSGWSGSGRMACAQSDRTLPGVSAPSSVVRSIMETAMSMACSLASFLIERVASTAERRSSPTWSTPGSPKRNRRSADSSRTASASGAGTVVVTDPSLGPRCT